MGLLLAEAFLSLSPRVVAVWALIGIALSAIITLGIDQHARRRAQSFWGGVSKWGRRGQVLSTSLLFSSPSRRSSSGWATKVQEPVSLYGGGEFVVLPLFTTAGLMLLASANDFILLFIALELVTISFYILVAYQRRSLVALEAGVIISILGGLSSAFSGHGRRLYFGLTGLHGLRP